MADEKVSTPEVIEGSSPAATAVTDDVLVAPEQVVIEGTMPSKAIRKRKAQDVVEDMQAENILANPVNEPIPDEYVPSVGIDKMPLKVDVVNGTVIEYH